MTPKDWAWVEFSLRGPFGFADLLIDGYEVRLEVKQVGVLKFEIVPFVNGAIKGAWLLEDCEERRRFLRPVHKSVWTPAKKKAMTKGLSKKLVRQYFPRIDEKLTLYTFGWPSFGPLKRHLIKNNTSIELKGAA
jgi:hypothetical protein